MTIKTAQLRQPEIDARADSGSVPPVLDVQPTELELRVEQQRRVSMFRSWVIFTSLTTILSALVLGIFLAIWIVYGIRYRWWVTWYLFVWIAFAIIFVISLITSLRRYFLFSALLAQSKENLQQQQQNLEEGGEQQTTYHTTTTHHHQAEIPMNEFTMHSTPYPSNMPDEIPFETSSTVYHPPPPASSSWDYVPNPYELDVEENDRQVKRQPEIDPTYAKQL